MARLILIYGQPGAGKSYSLRNLDPKSTVIIDADKKGALPFRGSRKIYSEKNKNYYQIDLLKPILTNIRNIGLKEEHNYIKVIVVDGLNSVFINEEVNYEDIHQTKDMREKYREIPKMTWNIIRSAKDLRDDLTVILIAHVKTADPYVQNDVDEIFTPGKMLHDKIKPEGQFNYVFYAKSEDKNYFFETQANLSTARSPEGCFDFRIPNDIAAAIETIKAYEEGEQAYES